MNEVCGVHQLPWKVVPAGISSKTGKPYSEFKVCSVKGCEERPNRLSNPQNITPPSPSQVPEAQVEEKPDWDAIAEGKVRHGVAVALLSSYGPTMGLEDLELTEEKKRVVLDWTKFIIEGK